MPSGRRTSLQMAAAHTHRRRAAMFPSWPSTIRDRCTGLKRGAKIISKSSPKDNIVFLEHFGYNIDLSTHREVAEWSKAHAWNACIGKPIEGSNPFLSASILALNKMVHYSSACLNPFCYNCSHFHQKDCFWIKLLSATGIRKAISSIHKAWSRVDWTQSLYCWITHRTRSALSVIQRLIKWHRLFGSSIRMPLFLLGR